MVSEIVQFSYNWNQIDIDMLQLNLSPLSIPSIKYWLLFELQNLIYKVGQNLNKVWIDTGIGI